MPTKRKIRRRVKEIRSVIRAPYVLPVGDSSGCYILIVAGQHPRQFETLSEALAARDDAEQVVTC